MKKVEASMIPAILDSLVGSTSANGDTYLDDESLQNIDNLEEVCGWVCDRISAAYSGDYPKQCASAEHVAHAVRRASGFILDYMCIDIEELRALADECDEMGDDGLQIGPHEVYRIARRIREALGVIEWWKSRLP